MSLKDLLMKFNDWLQLGVTTFAILFGVVSLWWFHWRKGRIRVSAPRSFMVAKTADKLVLELPMTFYNTGALPIVINNLLLEVRQEAARALLRFEFTRNELGDETLRWASQIAVDGGKAVSSVFDFQTVLGELSPQVGVWNCRLLGLTDDNQQYSWLARFRLNVKRLDGNLVAQDNYDEEYNRLRERFLRTK
ncbi:MAG: hypothetical protein V1894_02615 [Chloroflexota bacterium]